jgi:KDO2-lipid IV(A) lauroyltransferase
MCRYVVDFLRVSKTKPEHRVHDYDVVGRVLDRGKGAVVLLGHFGNWELLADLFGAKLDLRVVAKPMRNLLVDKWLARKRDAASVKTIFVDQALRKIYEGIKSNALVAVLIDQNAGSQGTQVSFLGREASTVRTVAGLVNKTGCGVIPCYALLRDDGSYDVVIAEAPPLDLAGMSDEECIAAYQIQHNGILSEWIRRNPEHWFGWFHRRWREHVEYD